MKNDDVVLVEWIQTGARATTHSDAKRRRGDQDLLTMWEARNLVAVGMVRIVGSAEGVVDVAILSDDAI